MSASNNTTTAGGAEEMDTAAATAAAAAAAAAAARHATIVIWTLYAVGICVTAMRIYARVQKIGIKRLQLDDYLVVVAALFYTCQTTLGYLVGYLAHGLANNAMTDAQRAALSPSDPEYEMRVIGSKIQVAGWTVYSTLVTVLKLAMAVFFLRLTSGLGSTYRMRVYVGFGLIVAGYVASIIAILAACQPVGKYWQVYSDPGRFCYPATSPAIVWTSFVSNVLSDIYLILIPIPLLWSSRLRILEKILSSLVLGAGIFVLVCATVKTVFIITEDTDGAEVAGAWGTREAFVAVIVTNLPMVFPLIKMWLKPFLGSMIGSRSGRSGGGGGGGGGKTPNGGAGGGFQVRTIGGGDWADRRGNGSSGNVLSAGTGKGTGSGSGGRRTRTGRGNPMMTDLSFADSEERIVMDEVVKMEDMGHGDGHGHDHGMKPRAVEVEIGVASGLGPGYGEERGNQVEIHGQGYDQAKRSSATDGKGIVVLSEVEVYEDRTSDHHHLQYPARVHEPW